MEIEHFIREIFKKMLFFNKPIESESQGCSHGITVMEEKVENDGREEVACPVCQKPILLPPALKCQWDCDLLIHISCLQVEYMWDPDKRVRLDVDEYVQTLIFHCGPGHGMIIEEEEKEEEKVRYDDEKKQAVCFACNEPLLAGPAYKCSTSHCPLLFHKSCAHFPRLTQHPLYDPNDTLVMRLAMTKTSRITRGTDLPRCHICGKRCINCICYSNVSGAFALHVTCAHGQRVHNPYDCQPHAFIPISGNFHFTCQVCGLEGKDFASQCTTCRLFVHGRCSGFSSAVSIFNHEHSLSFTFPLRQLKDSQNLSCNLCRKRVNADYAAYYCQICDFIADLPCIDKFWLRDETKETVALVTHDVEEMPLVEIHPHDLILSNKQLEDDKICDVCMQFIWTPPFYHCAKCNFFLHFACAKLPKNKRHPNHHHSLTLLSQAPSWNGIFGCYTCNRLCNGFTYHCIQCGISFDIHCCSIQQTLTHPSHQHSLFLAIASQKLCNACGRQSYFLCIDCDYSLCYGCITFPIQVKHEHDEHPLTLTYVVEDKCREYYCLICEKEKDPKCWFYSCSKCNFSAHIECVRGRHPYIKVGSVYNVHYHKHPLTLVQTRIDSSPDCDVCHKPFLDGLAAKCSQCKLTVHFPRDYDCLRRISN